MERDDWEKRYYESCLDQMHCDQRRESCDEMYERLEKTWELEVKKLPSQQADAGKKETVDSDGRDFAIGISIMGILFCGLILFLIGLIERSCVVSAGT